MLTGVVTFEIEPLTVTEMLERIKNIFKEFPFYVVEFEGELVGYTYANTWKTRAAYCATVETSIYFNPSYVGKGLGMPLYTQLLDELKLRNFHLAIGGISLPNKESVDFHLKCGFEYVGVFKEVGFKQDRWIDVAYYQKLLNSKSATD